MRAKKLKVVTIVGTRPEIIRLSCIIKKFDKFFDHTLVHTGQNYDYELNQIFFNDLGIRSPDYFLESSGKSSAETIGNVIINSDKLLSKIKPEAVLVLGDTNSCMSILSAKRKKIPTFHMEAGNRCFDERVPEEINRRLVDHMSDINIPYSSIAREYLLQEGLDPDMIIKVGSPMYEVLYENIEPINESKIIEKLGLKEDYFFLVSAHREENIEPDDNFSRLTSILNSISKKYKIPVIVSTHPRTRKKIKNSKIKLDANIRLLKPLGFLDYNKLQISSKAVLSDSGTINEEASILNFRALNLRESHERPEGMEEGAVMMTGLDKNTVFNGLKILESQPKGEQRLIEEVRDYSTSNVSEKMVRIVLSYTDYVNRKIWKKY